MRPLFKSFLLKSYHWWIRYSIHHFSNVLHFYFEFNIHRVCDFRNVKIYKLYYNKLYHSLLWIIQRSIIQGKTIKTGSPNVSIFEFVISHLQKSIEWITKCVYDSTAAIIFIGVGVFKTWIKLLFKCVRVFLEGQHFILFVLVFFYFRQFHLLYKGTNSPFH